MAAIPVPELPDRDQANSSGAVVVGSGYTRLLETAISALDRREQYDAGNLARFGAPLGLRQPASMDAEGRPVGCSAIEDTEWFLVTLDTGKRYYLDSRTRKAQWDIPDEVAMAQAANVDFDFDVMSDEESEGQRRKRASSDSSDEEEPEKKRAKREDKEREEESTRHAIDLFHTMLREKGIMPFDDWSKCLPKIAYDPRFKVLPDQESRMKAFNDWVKRKALEEQRTAVIQKKAALELFEELIEESGVRYDATYRSFYEKHRNDERLLGIHARKREAIFREFMKRKREKDSRKLKDEIAEHKQDFINLMKEKGEVHSNSRWERVAKRIMNDRRYELVSPEARVSIFGEYIKQLQEKKQHEKDSLRRLRQKEQEVRGHLQETEKERERVFREQERENAVRDFKSLLQEKVQTTKKSFEEVADILRKDPRWKNPELGSTRRKAEMFEDHLDGLRKTFARRFEHLLLSVDPQLNAKWEAVRDRIKGDERFALIEKDSEREDIFGRLQYRRKSEALNKLTKVLEELHREGQIHSGLQLDGEHYKNLLAILGRHHLWYELESIPREREDLVQSFVSNVVRRGYGGSSSRR